MDRWKQEIIESDIVHHEITELSVSEQANMLRELVLDEYNANIRILKDRLWDEKIDDAQFAEQKAMAVREAHTYLDALTEWETWKSNQ